MPFLDLAPSAPSDCRRRGPALSSSAAVPLGRGGGAVLGSPNIPSLPLSAPLSSLAWVVGGFPSPPCPRPSSHVTPSPLVSTPGFLSPRGNASTMGASMPCGDSAPPPTPWRPPLGFLPPRRPRGRLRLPPLRRARPPLRRPCGPPLLLTLCRACLPKFPAGRRPPPTSRGSRPIAVSCSCLVSGCGSDVAGVAPAGCCTLMCAVRAVFRWAPRR